MRVAAGPDAVAPGGHLWPEVALPRGQEHLPRRTRLLLHTLSRPRPPPGLYTRVAAPAAGCSGTAAAQLPAPRAGAPARHLGGRGPGRSPATVCPRAVRQGCSQGSLAPDRGHCSAWNPAVRGIRSIYTQNFFIYQQEY